MFTKEKSKLIKGIAILLMLFHHLFFLTSRVPSIYNPYTTIQYGENELIHVIALVSKICVSIFMFIGGFSLYLDYKNEKIKDNYIIKKIFNLFINYWKVFVIFVPIGLVFFKNQPADYVLSSFAFRFSDLSAKEIVTDFFAITSKINGEWWFLKDFIICIFYGCILSKIFKKCNNKYMEFFLCIVLYIFLSSVILNIGKISNMKNMYDSFLFDTFINISSYSTIFFIGMIFCKYSIFENWKKEFDKLKKVETIILFACLAISFVILRYFIVFDAVDLFFAPAIIFMLCYILDYLKKFKKTLMFIGNHSTNMWLIHSFYCYYFVKISYFIYSGDNALISFLKLFYLTLLSSIVINRIWKTIAFMYMKMRKHM